MSNGGYPLDCTYEVPTILVEDLTVDVQAEVYEVGGVAPTTIIRTTQDWYVQVRWRIKGALARLLCGEWCLCLSLESIGPGPEVRLPNPCTRIPMKPCEDHTPTDDEPEGEYLQKRITVGAGEIEEAAGEPLAGECGRGYLLYVSLQAYDSCGKPTSIFIHCMAKVPLSFYDPGGP